jgi:hypothetical protein
LPRSTAHGRTKRARDQHSGTLIVDVDGHVPHEAIVAMSLGIGGMAT